MIQALPLVHAVHRVIQRLLCAEQDSGEGSKAEVVSGLEEPTGFTVDGGRVKQMAGPPLVRRALELGQSPFQVRRINGPSSHCPPIRSRFPTKGLLHSALTSSLFFIC